MDLAVTRSNISLLGCQECLLDDPPKKEDRPNWQLYSPNVLSVPETADETLEDGTAYIITGDIPAMWLRDSAAQVRNYFPMSARDQQLRQIFEDLIKRQLMYIRIDPYANAFNKQPDNNGHRTDITKQSLWVFERKYEGDFLELSDATRLFILKGDRPLMIPLKTSCSSS